MRLECRHRARRAGLPALAHEVALNGARGDLKTFVCQRNCIKFVRAGPRSGLSDATERNCDAIGDDRRSATA
jgi:hypothetical protein